VCPAAIDSMKSDRGRGLSLFIISGAEPMNLSCLLLGILEEIHGLGFGSTDVIHLL